MDDTPKVSEHDVTTGKVVVRSMTAEEVEQREQDIANSFPYLPA